MVSPKADHLVPVMVPVVMMMVPPMGVGGGRRRHGQGADRRKSNKKRLHDSVLDLFTLTEIGRRIGYLKPRLMKRS